MEEFGGWRPVGDGVLIRRHAVLDQTLGLVVGSRRCLVIDTGTDDVHGAEVAAAVRLVTDRPWTVVLTHAHWDHVLGTAAFLACPVLAHPRCAAAIAAGADRLRAEGAAHLRGEARTDLADRVARANVVTPTGVLPDESVLDLGDRTVTLVHPGRGHTDHDLVVHVPDAGVLFAGDLVEQGAPPAVGPDAYPREWPAALTALLAREPRLVVPGHGEPVDAAFLAAQRDELARRRP